ncbi:hypothetical protein QFC19_000098 [Naganishia cerealis]|uniref:Uncharacterized protein n=1 Tax=Naganishia cerealis TaxID=610337 RepID=A0ACC2WQ52_9TREE|nr:hypothetical protein QFC19_000098 [Naganishia cerealis]
MGQKSSRPVQEKADSEERNAAPSSQVVPPAASVTVTSETRSPPVNAQGVVKESVPEPTVVPVTSPAPSERISQNGTNPAAQIENEKSGQVNAGTPSTKAKEKQLVSQKQQTQPKPQQPAQKQQPSQKQQSTQKQQPLQKQPAAQKQPATQKQPITQKPLSTQKPAKPQATQQQPIQQKQALGSKQPTQQGKAAKVKQKKQAKQSQAQSQASQPQTGKGKAVVDTSKATTTTLKSASQPVGGSLRARMSSPPKLISAQVTAATASIPSVSSLSNLATSSTSESSKMSSSSTGVRTVEKRRLEEDDHTSASAGKPNNASVKPSPKARGSKLARREGDVDTSGASSVQSKPSFPSPPPAMLQRLTIDADEKEEGEISDEEMQDPSPSATATGKTSLLDRLREAPASAYLTNPVPPATSGIGNLAPRMNPTLMARIDPRTSDGSSNPPPRRAPPVFTSQSSYQQRSATTFGSAGRMGSTNIVAAPSFTEAAKNEGDQPRTKAVIGRSGNMTTVNGVAISTSQGQGESKLDEAGQRELIEIVVELHNKGIPSDELIQRGVPAQLVNRVMKALTRPASVGDAQPSTFTASSATGTAIPRSSEPDYEGDMDMDIDDSEHEKSPQMTADAPASYTSAPAMMQFHPGFLPSMHMMPLRFHPTMPFMESTASLPAQQPQQPPPPPLPPAFSPQPPPPPLPPADAKLSLKEMKAKLLASRKVKQQSSMEADSNVLQPSDTNTPTVNEIAESATSTPRLNESLLSVKTAAQEDMPTDSDERAPSPTPSPIPASLAQSAITSRAPSPMPGVETAPISANPTLLNSRRPGAADFVDAPPSQLASSTFFRSNVRKTFAPPQPKRLVVDLDDTSDDSGSDRDDDDDGNRRQSDSELYMDETNSLRLMHEAELRIALERKKAELLEKRAKLAAYAARKKAAAQFAVETAAGIGSLSPNPIPTGLSPTPPVVSESALTTPLVQSPTHTPLLMPTAAAVPVASSTAHEARLSNGASDRSQDEGKQKEGGASKSSLKAEHRPLPITASLPHSRTARESLPVTDLTDADESPQVTAAVPAASSTSVCFIWKIQGWATETSSFTDTQAHFKPYHFFTPHVPLTSIQPNPEINTDILDLEALKKITLSRMMAEHRQRTGKAEDDPVVCKYELRGGACNVPDCPDFHMERDVVPSQQDLMRYIDLVLPAKKTSPPHTATIRQRLQQLVRSRPDVPLKAIGAESPESAKAGMDGTAAALKAKLKRQRQAKALQDCYQERKKDVEQFLDEMRKTLQDRAVSASAR